MSKEQLVQHHMYTALRSCYLSAFLPPQLVQHLPTTLHAGAIALLVVLLIVLLTPITLTLLLVCLKVDGVLDASWAITLLPLWITQGLNVITTVSSWRGPFDQPPSMLTRVVAAVKLGLTVAGPILICLRLDGVIAWQWSVVLIPSMITMAWHSPVEAAVWYEMSNVKVSIDFGSILVFVQVLLVGLKLDDILVKSWPVVFVPAWIAAGAVAVMTIVGVCCTGQGFIILLVVLLWPSPLVILAARLEGAVAFSSLYIVLPWFVVIGLIVVGAPCFLLKLAAAIDELEEPTDEVW